jgi:pyridoxine/pyridoxamine 5'-phosphate oxidase
MHRVAMQLQEDARTMEEPNARASILWKGLQRRVSIVGIINIVGVEELSQGQ